MGINFEKTCIFNGIFKGIPFADLISYSSFLNGKLNNQITGIGNTLLGANAGEDITSGNRNTFLGGESGKDSAQLNNNTGVGWFSNNCYGSNNTSIGAFSLGGEDGGSGNGNTAVGYGAMRGTTGGIVLANGNTAIGNGALNEIYTGDDNTAVGDFSLNVLTVGSKNTGIGSSALYSVTSGENNVSIGFEAGGTITTGSNNICLGARSDVPSGTSSNQIRLGDTNITYAGIQVAWTVTSDLSWKKNIKDLNLGINFINNLKPVEYIRKNNKNNKKEYGIIAQDLQKALEKFNIKDSGMIVKDDDEKLHLRYNDLIPILIKSIQDTDKRINLIEEKINGKSF